MMKRKTLAGIVLMASALMIVGFGGFLIGAQHAGLKERIQPTGWVVIEVYRPGVGVIYHEESHNLITNAGLDFISAQLGSTSPGANGANYIALSTDATAPSPTDTTLAGEITTGGLARAQGTYAHTAGSSTYTVSKTFTATASFTGVRKSGLFTAAAGGTMMAENTFTPVNLESGDQITVTWTITV